MAITVITITHSEPSTTQLSQLLNRSDSTNPKGMLKGLMQYIRMLQSGRFDASIDIQVGEGISVAASGTVTCSSVLAGDVVTLDGIALTAVTETAGANQFSTGVRASRVIQDLTYTADLVGSGGNSITVANVAPSSGTNALSIGVVGNAITVNLESIGEVAASGTLNLADDIILTSVAGGTARNTDTFEIQVAVAAANPTDTVLADFTGTGDAIVCTITPNDGTNNLANPNAAANASLNLTADITLSSVAAGSGRNSETFTLEVAAAAANPTDTILADFTGTSNAIVCTITPNDGTNNGATPVNLTTAELVELINSGVVVGKTVTVTDTLSLRALQTAAGGDATNLADAGEGDGVLGTFSGGTNDAVGLTTAELRELINSGVVVGKTVTVTDGSSLRALQTATGGGAAALADSGEGDGVSATFSGGVNFSVAVSDADAIKAAIDLSAPASALISVVVSGTGSDIQVASGAANLQNGSGSNSTCAASLVSAILANATLNQALTSSNALGVVTISCVEKGDVGNLVTLASSNGSRLAVSGARLAGGVDPSANSYSV